MLPPPALTVSIRIEGSASGMPATAPPPSCTAVPPVTRLASALVPPISSVRSSDSPTADRKSTRLNSSHSQISYAVFCLKKKKRQHPRLHEQLPHSLDP